MRVFLLSLSIIAALDSSSHAYARRAGRASPPQGQSMLWEARVQQIPAGVMEPPGKLPELAPVSANAKTASTSSAPATCTAQNASSQACATTAGAQARSVAK
jgi:hypothetical protein